MLQLLGGLPCGSLAGQVDALVMDLGVSSMQARRGVGGGADVSGWREGHPLARQGLGGARVRRARDRGAGGLVLPERVLLPAVCAARGGKPHHAPPPLSQRPSQLDTASRGFSFAADGPLDMRLDPGAPLSAADLVNTWGEAQLGRALLEYGEERAWKTVARRWAPAAPRAP